MSFHNEWSAEYRRLCDDLEKARSRISALESHLRYVLDEVRDCELTGAGYLSLQRACEVACRKLEGE